MWNLPSSSTSATAAKLPRVPAQRPPGVPACPTRKLDGSRMSEPPPPQADRKAEKQATDRTRKRDDFMWGSVHSKCGARLCFEGVRYSAPHHSWSPYM